MLFTAPFQLQSLAVEQAWAAHRVRALEGYDIAMRAEMGAIRQIVCAVDGPYDEIVLPYERYGFFCVVPSL
jgi:hypothetical protein